MGPVDLIRRIRASVYHLDVLNNGLDALDRDGGDMCPELLVDAMERLQRDVCAEVLELLDAFCEAESLGLMDLLAAKARSISVEIIQ